ncbi:MAG TPA: LytTR family DNA-binding domain-containing protein [Bacteroidia bacterium]|nr:LytTR family DNA-binding domain-containing protein [Bacteroidia bacterium]
MNIVIIEDEPMMALDLAADLGALRPDWQVVATLGSVKSALEWLSANKRVDLIFSDIQLGDGTCFDVFARVPAPAPVIFCTAFDQYALQAFQANGIGYLLKPHGRDSLRAAVEKYEKLRPAAPDLHALLAQLHPKPVVQTPQSILVHHKDRIIPVPLADVALFFLHHENTMLLRMDGQRFPLQQTLAEVEELAGPDFFRASRQHLVHRKVIREASQYFARKLLLNLTVPFDEAVTVSKEKVGGFLEWLGG